MFSLVAIIALLGAACGSSGYAASDPQALGESLVVEYYEDLKTGRNEELESQLAEGFQSITRNGALVRSQVVERIDEGTFGDYELSDFQVTQAPDTLIVAYRGTIESGGETPPPTWRVNVFRFIGDRWLGVTFADAS